MNQILTILGIVFAILGCVTLFLVAKNIYRTNKIGITPVSAVGQLNEDFLFNFHTGYAGGMLTPQDQWDNGVTGQLVVGPFDGNTPMPRIATPEEVKNGKSAKIKIKPIDVLQELETTPTPFSLALLDQKIEMLKQKEPLITQHYAKRETMAILERLEIRKKYSVNSVFFNAFQNTTMEAIDKLLSKYALVMKPSDIFVPEFPDEAIKVMTAYTAKVMKLSGKKPVYYVIAEENDFKKAYEKRDPILLVQSPFGFFYQILGAWDKEMLILSEL